MPTLFVTAPTDAAERLASGLVEAELAACVNAVDCESTYRWEGEVHHDDEVILLVKTTDEAAPACRDWLDEHHPYDVPCVERFDESDAASAFADWRSAVVAVGGRDDGEDGD